MSLVAPTIRDGGVNCVYVLCVCVWYVASMISSLKMCLATLHLSPETECLIEKKLIDAPPPPNMIPPITTVKQAVEYRSKLQALEPNVDFLMSLYLHESMTVETMIEAKVKSYPAGVTTNSSLGVVDYASYYLILKTKWNKKTWYSISMASALLRVTGQSGMPNQNSCQF